MKRLIIKIIIILTASTGLAILLPNFFKQNRTIEIPSAADFTKLTLFIFAVIWSAAYVIRPKEKPRPLLDGYYEFYNEKNQLTRKGNFNGGRQIDGKRYVYNKNGTLSHVEKCVNGSYSKDI